MSTTTAITGAGRDSGEPATAPMPTPPSAPAPLTGFAAGAAGAALLVAGVWGLHMLSSANGEMSVGSVVLLLAAFSALGKGISLIQQALAPISAAAAAALSGVPTLVRALAAIVVGATGVWWVMRGHAASWWAQATGTTGGWTLISALVQVVLIAAAGALLFGGAKSLAGLVVSASDTGQHHHAATTGRARRERWASWWSTRPGLGLMLLAGAAALVTVSGYLVPRVTGWLLGVDRPAAVAAIAAILIGGLLANTWWWGALSGWWDWAHHPHTPGGSSGVTPMGQMQAGAAVVALLWFSATAFGLAVPGSYAGPGAMPRARADCPPDCGGGSSGSGSSGPAFPMQPPDMPSAPGGYNSGSYPAPDQANGISIYNPGQQSPGGQSGYPQYPQQAQPGPPANGQQPLDYDAPTQAQAPALQQGTPAGQQAPANGSQPPNYDAPARGAAPQQAPSVPQQAPAQQQQAPAQQQPQQGPAQQGRQEPDGRQPQGQPGQQNQPAQQQPQQPAQQQQRQNTNQQLPKFPSKDKKNHDNKKQNGDNQSGDTDLSTLLFGAVSSSRRRKQDQGQRPDEPQQPDQQERGPDTQALAQDGAQAAQGIPGDVQTYVQSGQQIGESAGQATQGFGQAGQAGASLASSAQSGAVNPQDVQSLIQGTAQGVQSTADAVNAGSQIVKTTQKEADQVAQAVGDANPQLKPQAEKLTQLNDQTSQVTDLVGQVAQLTSQGAGVVNSVSSLGVGGMPDSGGTAEAMSGPTNAAAEVQSVELMSGPVRQDVPVGDTPTPPDAPAPTFSITGMTPPQQTSRDKVDLLTKVPGKNLSFTGDPKEGTTQLNGAPNPINKPGERALPMGYALGQNDRPYGMFSIRKYSETDGELAKNPWNFISPRTSVYDLSNPTSPALIGQTPGSQSSGAYDPISKTMVIVGNDGWGSSAPRSIWQSTPVDPSRPNDWINHLTKIGDITGGGDRENQILALPGGGLLLLDANMNPINGGVYGATAWAPQQLLNPDWTYLVAGDSAPNPNALGTVNSVYGPTASAVTQGPAGSNILNVAIGMSAWPFNEADPAGYHPETWTSTLSILVQQPPTS